MRTAFVVLLVLACSDVALAQDLEVFQDLEEVTSRIPNLQNKPYKALIDANDGFLQDEVIIFHDVETGKEVWSLSREECWDMAHTGRRPAWSCNGQYISFRGNQVFWNLENDQLWKRTWSGYSYVANADGSRKRPLWATVDGKVRKFNCDKYNMWDAKRPGTWYCTLKDQLWRVTIDDSLIGSKAEAVYTFPGAAGKIIQEISDANFMLIEEGGDKPNCYVIDLNRDPKDPGFCMTYPLKGQIHSGSFRIRRAQPVVTGGYETRVGLTGGVCLSFETGELKPVTLDEEKTEGREMAHLWYGPPDDRVGFFGKYNGKMGLWVQLPGKEPVLAADVPDGHVTWCGRDPEWFFAAVGPGRTNQQEYSRRLLAASADGKTVEVVCTPYDRRRPGESNYSSIPLPTQSRDGNKCWFHSSMLLSTNLATGSYIAVFRKPHPPTDLKLNPGATEVVLQWTPHPVSFEVKGYLVWRSADGGKTWLEVTDKPVPGSSFSDGTAEPGKTYVYALTAEEWSRLESDVTSKTLTVEVPRDHGARVVASGEGVRGWDKTPPAKVASFKTARGADGLIVLSWDANTEKDFRCYNIYASSAGKPEVSQKRLLVSPTHGATKYIDWTAPAGKAIHYAVVAIDRQGNVSEAVYADAE